MSTPPGDRGAGRRDPETGGRSLADILREAGVESPTRGWRRRGDDLEDTGVRQRGADGDRPPGRVTDRPAFGRRASDRAGDPSAPSTAAIPGLRPSRKPGVPGAAARAAADGSPGAAGASAPTGGGASTPTGGRARTADTGPSTGPIPVVRADDPPLLDDEPLGAREGALAWLRFGGELLVALAVGVGLYFLFTVVWEQLPYLAVVLAPLAVAGLVAGVGAWRQRQDREPAGVRLVGVLVFAATLLTIAPAAGLLSGG
ncbi:hypothetical protein DQ238_13625 [Geodermatophilus sp. TF02-6]|uniref:hypothetical protein n=1 Tax=Geodermatophilus sp. TF02-6 TaxID=2250575 RepID=UPI000DE8F0E5|nr:hypothetical protein [Geodermatophilus sp. TF02-6]RBY78220.1 hypothetical protein DQ238_13625 [Geodermatophilus sp. TF02-6]